MQINRVKLFALIAVFFLIEQNITAIAANQTVDNGDNWQFNGNYDTIDAPISHIPGKKLGYFYGVVSGGLGQHFFKNSTDGDIISQNAGFLSKNPAGILSILAGYQFKILRNFDLGLDIVGRWLFFDNSGLMAADGSVNFNINQAQMLLFQIKPTLVFHDGKYGVFASVGVGGQFAVAGGVLPAQPQNVNFFDFALSYGLGVYAFFRPNVAIHLNMFTMAQLNQRTTLLTEVVNISVYGIELGIKFST
ncbi:MAG: hypothetical protein JJW01_03080 [Alphaproteobacteria bacterium]|nr:hypothetical protein [Rickettsiales bacterium]